MGPKVSVLVPMYRPGGWDVVCDSLRGQTHRDFELVVADAIYRYRADIVREKLEAYPFAVKHLPPSGGVALSDYSHAINDAVAHCSGELVVIQSDYTWMPPDCLATHWAAYQSTTRRRKCYMLDNHCTELPPLHPTFRGYGPNWEAKPYITPEERTAFERQMTEAADEYEADLASGRLADLMWSIFKQPLTWGDVQGLKILRSHVKQGQSLDPNWCSLKNEGIPTEAFLAVNGLDEDMDGSHLYQDQEFAWRVARAGYAWTTYEGGGAYMVNPRSVLYCKRLLRPQRGGDETDSNESRMYRKQRTGERVNPHRDLRAERRANR